MKQKELDKIIALKEHAERMEKILRKMCEWHENHATWDKGDNGYYEAKKELGY